MMQHLQGRQQSSEAQHKVVLSCKSSQRPYNGIGREEKCLKRWNAFDLVIYVSGKRPLPQRATSACVFWSVPAPALILITLRQRAREIFTFKQKLSSERDNSYAEHAQNPNPVNFTHFSTYFTFAALISPSFITAKTHKVKHKFNILE